METNQKSQGRRSHGWERQQGIRSDLIIPNPKLKLLDQVREVMRLKHYSIRTERSYGDWIRRYIGFHKMRSREDLNGAEPKIEQFLSDLAVNGHVSASTQNQADLDAQQRFGAIGGREWSDPQVPGCQWDALKAWRCGCQLTIMMPPAIHSLTAPGAHADLAVASPDTRRTLAVAPLIGDKRCYGECPARLRRGWRHVSRKGTKANAERRMMNAEKPGKPHAGECRMENAECRRADEDQAT